MSYSPSQIRLLTRVAWLYYEESLTQKEIGERLGYSRVKINRLLQQAREQGIVEINITTPDAVYVELEQALCHQFDLKDAVVVTEAEPGRALYMSLVQGAADWMSPKLEDGTKIGLGQGRTISHLPLVFKPDPGLDCQFLDIIGGANQPDGFSNYNITSQMAEVCNGQAFYIYAPTIVSTCEIRDSLLSEPSIASALAIARQADIVLHSVGPIDTSALLYIHGYLDQSGLDDLVKMGAVGDTLSQFYDIDGNHIPHPLSEQTIGLNLEDLRQIPYSVVMAAGPEKVEPIIGAIRGRLLNVLITDFHTARSILETTTA